jgi:hypothetical protein
VNSVISDWLQCRHFLTRRISNLFADNLSELDWFDSHKLFWQIKKCAGLVLYLA